LLVALGFLLAYAVAAQLAFPADPGRYGSVAVLAFFAAAGYLLLYKSLQIGPVSVVSPITATSSAATVVFAVLLLGERPSVSQWAAVPIATAGAVLSSIVFVGRERPGLVGPAPLLAGLSVILGSVSNAGLRVPIRDIGPIQAIIGQRVFTVVVVAVVVAYWLLRARRDSEPGRANLAFPGRSGREPPSRRSAVGILVALGLTDAVGFGAFAFGLLTAPAWLVGLTSQSGRLAAGLAALLFLGERLTGTQWVGLVLVTLGVLLAVA
jgi:drug/metabolite transporter (DMT)-like permease